MLASNGDVRWRCSRGARRLDPAASEASSRRELVPANSHLPPPGLLDDPGARVLASSLLGRHPDQRGLRPPEIAPVATLVMTCPLERSSRRSCSRRNSGCRPGCGSASITSYSCVVTYSWWPAKTIRSYASASVRRFRPVEVGVGQEVDVLCGVREPAEERQVVGLEVRRHARSRNGRERRTRPSRRTTCRASIAVVVAEVVCLPVCVGSTTATRCSPSGADGARRGIADSRARRGQTDEVDAAGPVAERRSIAARRACRARNRSLSIGAERAFRASHRSTPVRTVLAAGAVELQ